MKKLLACSIFAGVFLFAGNNLHAQVKEKKQEMISGSIRAISSDSLITLSGLIGNLPKVGQEAEADNVMIGCGIAYIPAATVRVESVENDSVITIRIVNHLPREWGDATFAAGERFRLSWSGPAGKKVGDGKRDWDF